MGPKLLFLNYLLFDKNITMESHVNQICKSSYSNIRLINRIRRSLTAQSSELLVRSLVHSRIDYCSTVLYGITAQLMTKLQRVLNSSLRLIGMLKKHDSISESYKRHKWLPISEKIRKRWLLLIFKVKNGMAPSYLQNQICDSTSLSSLSFTVKFGCYQTQFSSRLPWL